MCLRVGRLPASEQASLLQVADIEAAPEKVRHLPQPTIQRAGLLTAHARLGFKRTVNLCVLLCQRLVCCLGQ